MKSLSSLADVSFLYYSEKTPSTAQCCDVPDETSSRHDTKRSSRSCWDDVRLRRISFGIIRKRFCETLDSWGDLNIWMTKLFNFQKFSEKFLLNCKPSESWAFSSLFWAFPISSGNCFAVWKELRNKVQPNKQVSYDETTCFAVVFDTVELIQWIIVGVIHQSFFQSYQELLEKPYKSLWLNLIRRKREKSQS